MSGRRRVIAEGVIVGIAQVATVVVYAVGFRFVTESYQPAVFGEATLLLGVAAFVFALTLNPLLATHLRFYPEYRERALATWFDREVRRHLVKLTAIIAGLGLAAGGLWSATGGTWKLVVGALLIVLLVGQTAFTFETDILSATRRQGRLAPLRVLRVFAYPFVAVALAHVGDPSLVALVGSAAASYWIPWLVVRQTGWTRSPDDRTEPAGSESRDFLAAAALYGGPFLVLAIAAWVSSVGDRYIVALHLDIRDVGVYAAIYGLFTQPFLMLAGGLAQWLRPILFDAVAEKRIDVANRVLSRWVAAGLVLSLTGGTILWFTRGFWFHLLLADEYHHGGWLVLYLLIANTMYVVTSALNHQLLAAKRTSAQLVPLTGAAVVNVVCNLAFIPRWGLDGAGLATATSFTVHCLLTLVEVKRTSLGLLATTADDPGADS